MRPKRFAWRPNGDKTSVRYSFRGAAVRGVIVGVLFAVVMYPLNFGFGESVADGLACAILVALILYGQGRTRPLLRRIAKRS